MGFTKEIGQILSELSPAGLEEVLKRFRGILHEGTIDKRVQYTIENLFAIRRNGFKDFPAVHEQLDLIEASDQITHDTSLDDESIEIEDHLDVFNEDPEFQENEKLWAEIRREVLDDSDDSGSEGGDESESGSSSDDDDGGSSSSDDDSSRPPPPNHDDIPPDFTCLKHTPTPLISTGSQYVSVPVCLTRIQPLRNSIAVTTSPGIGPFG